VPNFSNYEIVIFISNKIKIWNKRVFKYLIRISFLSGCIACHGVTMWYDLYGASKFGLDATFDLMAEHITTQFHRGY